MTFPVVIVEYNPQWPGMFLEEKKAILALIGHILMGVEHIGSTAVPGLAAKPIIDILAGVRQLSDAQECIQPLLTLRYEYVPEHEESIPDRRYFHKGPPKGRTHHLHMVEVEGEFWRRHLAFRDYLRVDRECARRYEQLKRDLAVAYRDNRGAYTEAKTEFIEAIIARAIAGKPGDR